jgi:hypothetical protein
MVKASLDAIKMLTNLQKRRVYRHVNTIPSRHHQYVATYLCGDESINEPILCYSLFSREIVSTGGLPGRNQDTN